jgi:phosphatidylglycerophosphate synthase
MQAGYVAVWMFGIIALREVAVTVSRIVATRKGHVIAAEKSGKIKTILQIVVIILMLVYQNLQEFSQTAGWADATSRWWGWLIQLLLLVTVYVTVQSGWEYFQNKKRTGC